MSIHPSKLTFHVEGYKKCTDSDVKSTKARGIDLKKRELKTSSKQLTEVNHEAEGYTSSSSPRPVISRNHNARKAEHIVVDWSSHHIAYYYPHSSVDITIKYLTRTNSFVALLH
jgi:hypothetical protein